MADFPGKVTTETSAPPSQHGGIFSTGLEFMKTLPGLLMLVEIALGLLIWALISGSYHSHLPAFGWVMFVAVALWIITTILFFVFFFSVEKRLAFAPWTTGMMLFNGVATVLYLTAFLANAITIPALTSDWGYNNLAASSFFEIVVTLVYGASTYFSFMAWRYERGGNAASSTVPT